MRLTSRVAKALSGKTAIVTASTDGIGFAIAKRLAQDGAKVWISSRKQDNVDAALDELRGMDLDVDGMGLSSFVSNLKFSYFKFVTWAIEIIDTSLSKRLWKRTRL